MSLRFQLSIVTAGCVAAALSVVARPVRAQMQTTDFSYLMREGYGTLSYEAALPTGDAKDFVSSSMSWLGISFGGHWMVKHNISAGFESGWNEFYDRSGGTTTLSVGAVTGEQYRHLIQFPLLASARFYSTGSGRVRAFGGVGVGAYYTRQLLDIGLNEYTANNWQFGLAPEAGVLMLTKGESILQLRVKYNYPVSGGTWLSGGSKSFNNLSFGIGAGFRH
jgi:hypothetical protein